MSNLTAEDKKIILNSIRDIPDFPKPGIVFKDITTLLNNHEAYQTLMNHLENRYRSMAIDYIVGLDARGFIFGASLADRLKCGFVPVRKKGKLPGKTISCKYELEYGFDEVELHIDAFPKPNANILIIDDLIATGGTATAAAKLVQQTNANLKEICFILNLKFLEGDKKLEKFAPVYSVLEI